MKQKYEFESVVAETLLIPLYMRAKESRRGKDAILHDEFAEELAESIEYDYSKFDKAKMSELGCVVRDWYFDNAIRRFIERHPEAVVVNVGAGLDTRAQRIGNRRNVLFYELDLPEVIELRRRLMPAPDYDRYIAASLLETEWLDGLKSKHPGACFIFVVSGVLMYFYEEQVKSVLRNIAERFSGGELWLDVCGPVFGKKIKPDSLQGSKAEIRCGIERGSKIEEWEPRLSLIEQADYMQFFRKRWGFLFGQILGRLPWLCRKFSSLMGFAIR